MIKLYEPKKRNTKPYHQGDYYPNALCARLSFHQLCLLVVGLLKLDFKKHSFEADNTLQIVNRLVWTVEKEIISTKKLYKDLDIPTIKDLRRKVGEHDTGFQDLIAMYDYIYRMKRSGGVKNLILLHRLLYKTQTLLKSKPKSKERAA